MSDNKEPIAIREQIKEFMGDKPMEVKLDNETSISCPNPESLFVASIKVMMKNKNEVSYDNSKSKIIVIGNNAALTKTEYQKFFGKDALSKDSRDQVTFKCSMVNSICDFYGIDKNQLRMIRKPEAERTDEEKQVIAGLDIKPEEVNVLFDKCSRVINGEELETVLKNEVKNDEPEQNPESISKTPREQIAEMIKNGNGSCEIKIGKNSYLFSDPETVLKKYVAGLYLQTGGINKKYLDKNNTEIKFTNTNDNEELEKGDYDKLFGGTDEDILEGDKAETIAIKLRRKFVKETAAKTICNFYGIKAENLVGIVKKEEKKEELSNNEQQIFNLFNDCKSILVGEKTLVEIQEKKEDKEYSKIEKMTWTDDVKKEAIHNMSKDSSRKNLDYTQISFEELNSRLKDLTGRTFDQIIKDIAKFVNDNKHNDKLRLNDALFGTGKFGGQNGKKVKRKLRLTEWFKSLGTKRDTMYPLNDLDKKAPSVLKPNERSSYIVDMARGAFDACLRRMISLAPNAFDNDKIGIKLKEKEGHFARNLGKIRFFSDRGIRESFDLAKGTRADTSFWSPKQTKKSFFQKIASVYLKTPKLQELLHKDKMEIEFENEKYTIKEASDEQRRDKNLEYDSRAQEMPIIDKYNNITENGKKVLKNIDLEDQNKKLRDDLQTAQSQNTQLQNDLKTAQNEKSQIEEANKGKDTTITALTTEGTALQKQNQNLQKQSAGLKEKYKIAKANKRKFKEISKILSKYKEENDGIKISNEDFKNLQNCLAAMGIMRQSKEGQVLENK